MPQAIAAWIVEKGGDYVLALKGNQSSLHKDVRLFIDDPVLVGTCATQPADIDAPVIAVSKSSSAGSRTPAGAERHPKWKGLRSLEAITEVVSTRIPARKTSRRGSSLPRSSRIQRDPLGRTIPLGHQE